MKWRERWGKSKEPKGGERQQKKVELEVVVYLLLSLCLKLHDA